MEIWEHRNKEGKAAKCDGKYRYKICRRYDLGRVGDNEASSIQCTCPRDFDYVTYDIPSRHWKLDYNENDGIEIDEVIVRNPCYGGGSCPNQSVSSTREKFQINIICLRVVFSIISYQR